jgi:hypothetical protein
MSNSGGFSSMKLSRLNSDGGADDNYIWNTEKINKILDAIENEGLDVRTLSNTPFKDNDITQKKPNLAFEYTPEEFEELRKCKEDVLYFAYNYCHIMTSKGVKLLKDTAGLRDYQEEILTSFCNNNLNILMASRQIGKSVTSGIFILWFLLFNNDKTALVVADNSTTTKELIDKFKIALDNLPFFIKPGIKNGNVMSLKFDNDSRLVGRTTTKKSGIGLSINLLYMDEFAHINDANLDEFYRAVFPTVTADPDAKIIITSTPNGKNKFYDIWTDAVAKKSSYVPLRVDWWQVPGRDDAWKIKTIADLGSIDDFNQEYGLQFFSSDQLMLGSKDLKRLYNMMQDYQESNVYFDENKEFIRKHLRFHPKYASREISDFKNDPGYYIFSIDTADGIGGDYSVLNIFKVVCLPVKELQRKKESVRNELDTISLVQIGTFRTNELDINAFASACEHIIYKIFNPERTRIVLEMNHKGDILLNMFKDNPEYWSSQMIHSKHTELAVVTKPGLRLGPTNRTKYCEKLTYLINLNKIIPNDYFTIMELMSFGKSSGGVYRGQNGNDDLAMTCVNLSSVFDSSQFFDVAVDTFENMGVEYAKEIERVFLNVNRSDNERSMYDYGKLREMNNVGGNDTPQNKSVSPNVFDSQSLEQFEKIKRHFFKS